MARLIFSNEAHRGWMPWAVLAPILAIVFVILGGLPFELLLTEFGFISESGDFVGDFGLLLFLLLPFSMMAVMVLSWTRWIEKRSLSSLGLSNGGWRRFTSGLGVGALSVIAVVGLIFVFGGYRLHAWLPALSSWSAILGIIALLVGFAVQSSAEELLFRGWLFSVVCAKFNLVLGFIFNAVVFSFLHFSPDQPLLVTINSALFAVFTCSWALRRGQIWGVMGWHAGWNWLMGTGFGIPITGLEIEARPLLAHLLPAGDAWLTGAEQGPEGSIFCSLLFVLGSTYFFIRKDNTKAEDVEDSPPSQALA